MYRIFASGFGCITPLLHPLYTPLLKKISVIDEGKKQSSLMGVQYWVSSQRIKPEDRNLLFSIRFTHFF